jgi:hypothetical protein
MNSFSFKRGYGQVQNKDLKDVKRQIMEALNLKNRASWYQRLNGAIEPKITEARSIEEIFSKYGISTVWGD